MLAWVAALSTMPCGAADLVSAAVPQAAVASSAAPAPARHAAARSAGSTLDERVDLLAAELRLSATQKLGVRALLQGQREQVKQVWSDANLPPAVRVGRTQAISERTADGIRALLDEEQRKKYIQPRRRDTAVGAQGAGVESWMAPAGSH